MKPLFPPKLSQETYLKAISVLPKKILSSNTKLHADGIWNVTMPAQRALVAVGGSPVELNTCPCAGACKAFCYSSSGCYGFHGSMVKHGKNLQFLMSNPLAFADTLVKEIESKVRNPKIKNFRAIRWNDSGDWFSLYWNVAKSVMNRLPNVKFYCYTKMVAFMREEQKKADYPKNFTAVFSFGGTQDNLIDKATDRHAIAFPSRSILRKYHYTEAFNSDVPATNPKTMRVGLIAHGNHLAIGKIKAKIAAVVQRIFN